MGRVSNAKERLMLSAAELVYSRSYQGVGVEELCEHSGVKKGSFYHFFPSKGDLILAALDFQWDLARDGLVEPAFEDDLPPLARIRRFFDLVAQASAHEKEATGRVGGCRFGNLSAEMGSLDPKIGDKVQSVFEAIATYFQRALAEAVAIGEVSNIDPEVCAKALLAYMEGVLLLGRTYNDPELMKRLGEKAIHLAIAEGALDNRTLPEHTGKEE